MGHSGDKTARRHIMITGCAGYLGKAICREIVAKGESIIGLYHQRLPEALDRMMPLCADLRSPEALLAPLRSVDTVVHLAWEGGVLGSEGLRNSSATRERISAAGNAAMTANLVRAMERQHVKRIIFVSWLGAQDESPRLIQREKYWAENVILNSKIPEKIIVRCGVVVDPEDKTSEFAGATQRLTKLPLITPLPGVANDLVFTAKREIVDKLVELATSKKPHAYDILQEITSTGMVSSADAMAKFCSKWWGQRKWLLGGFIGRQIFALVDSEFGRLASGRPKIMDFLALSKGSEMLTGRLEASGQQALLP